jgi:ribonuclease Z
MEKLIVLGTGNAMVTRCYNTCFAIFDGEDYFLVDGSGGNGILKQTDNARIPFERVRNLFVSHAHIDHILGVIWVIRKITTMLRQGKYEPPFTIYCYPELVEIIWTIAKLTLVLAMLKQIEENNVLFRSVADGDTAQIGHYGVTFFDIHSTETRKPRTWKPGVQKQRVKGSQPGKFQASRHTRLKFPPDAESLGTPTPAAISPKYSRSTTRCD